MFKIKMDVEYFEANFKKQKQDKPKYLLTQQQKQFIQILLPKKYKFNIVNQIDQKRNRMPKKNNPQFDLQVNKKLQKKDLITNNSNQKKFCNKQQKKDKIKLQNVITNTQKQQKNGKIQQQVKEKQNKTKEQTKNKPQIQQKNTTHNKIIDTKIHQIKQQKTMKIQQQNKQKKTPPPPPPLPKKQFQTALTIKKQQSQRQKLDPIQHHFKSSTTIKDQTFDLPINTSLPKPYQLLYDQKQLCLRFINKLKSHKSSWPFRNPVDPITQCVPNYLSIIHEPMDLKTIQKKINANKYQHISQFYADINKIFLNSYKFNPKQTNYYALTVQLQSYYHQLLKQVEINHNTFDPTKINRVIKNKIAYKNNNQQDFIQQNPPQKKKKYFNPKLYPQHPPHPNLLQTQTTLKQYTDKFPLLKSKSKYTKQYKKQLVKKLTNLSSSALQNILFIVFNQQILQIQQDQTVFNLDLQNINDSILYQIQHQINYDNTIEEEQRKYHCKYTASL